MGSFSRELIVDRNGTGDYTTLAAGLTAAVAAGADGGSPNTFYTIRMGSGIFVENTVWPHGIRVIGQPNSTRIQGYTTLQAGSAGYGIIFDLGNGNPSSSTFAVRLEANAGMGTYLETCVIQNALDYNGVTAALECGGSSVGAFFKVTNCWIYAANRIVTAAPLAVACPVRLRSDFAAVLEIQGGSHFKSSTGGGASVNSILLLNEQTGGPSVPWGYAQLAGDWIAVYAGDVSPAPILMRSLNTTHPGGTLSVTCHNPGGKAPTVESAFSGVATSAGVGVGAVTYSTVDYNAAVEAGVVRRASGAVYDIPPVYRLNHTPTVADVAPDGSVVFVA